MYLDFGISSEEFRATTLYKQPKLFKNAVKYLDITWRQINEIYQRANPRDELFRLRKGEIVPVEEYVEDFNDTGRVRHRFIKPSIYHHMKNGATIVYNRINNEPFVDNLARQVSHFVQAPTVVSGYLAFGSDASFKSHWDTRDVFAIQLVGKKHWSLSKPNFEMPLYMQQAKDMGVSAPDTVDMEVVLEAGDVLYIPRGWWHNPVPMNCETFHLAVGTFAPTGYEYLEWLMNKFPELLAVRHNLSDWQSDKVNISAAAEQISHIIQDENNYEAFMQAHMAKYRSDSAFNMQIFGDANAGGIPDDTLIVSNIVDARTIDKGYIIANGLKINIDAATKPILQKIVAHEPIQLQTILQDIDKEVVEQVKDMLYKLAELDVIELIL